MLRLIKIIIMTNLILLGAVNFPAYALTEEELLEKLNALERELSEVRSELRELKNARAATADIVSKKEETATSAKLISSSDLKMYGFIKTDFVFDDSRTNNADATGYALSENSIKDDTQFTATAQHSRFGLDFSGPELNDGKVGAKVEIDFLDSTSANSFKPRIRHLYVDLAFPKWSVLFGQTWDVAGPLGPSLLNTNGWLWRAGNIGFRRTQMRLTNKFSLSEKDNLTTQVSANRNIGSSNGSVNTGEDSGMPLFEARASIATTRFFDRKLELGIAGLYGKEEIDRSSATTNDHWKAEQWAVVADVLVPIGKKLTLKGELFTGRDLGTFLAGIGQGVNTTKETSISAYGGWGEISCKLNDSLTFNSGYGRDNAEKDDINNSNPFRNQVIFTNILFSPIENLTFGLEYSYWYTEFLNLKKGNDNKIQTSVIWSF